MNFVWSRKHTVIAFLITSLTVLGFGSGLVWYLKSKHEGIVPYEASRDQAAIVTLFKDNWYWLIPEETAFSVEDYLTHRSPDQGIGEDGSAVIFVYQIHNKTVGMVSYYPMSFYKGRLHFIVVDKGFRGRGISDKLLQYVLDQMKQRGFSIVELITRVDNIPAQKLYQRFGFKEFFRDNRFVRFEKELL